MMSLASEPGGPLPIVGIGASAGGLEAFTQLLRCLPPDSDMAFVLVQHLDRTHASYLRDALATATTMTVSEVADGTIVEANHVYVIPPNKCLAISGGQLSLSPRPEGTDTLNLPIDFFFRALAADRGSRALGVVLSGTASDGTEGLRAIKAENGITFAQAPQSAKFSGMPLSAVTAGVVDYCLPIPQLAEELVRLSRHSHVATSGATVANGNEGALARVFAVVRKTIGVDFTEYKAPTFQRRLHRRMAVRGVEQLDAYCSLLEAEPDEVRSLYEDVLIHFTSFFRDPHIFEALKRHAFPEILRNKKTENAPLRLWVAGCSTGEELYSLAIVLLEFLGDTPRAIQIFGSDVSDKAIDEARAGFYPESALREVSEERRKSFFVKADGGYRINQRVRDLCVFVQHDLARDPPFSKLDLVSCRNVLIYFDQGLQKRIFPSFHYALNQPGFLLLGSTESISGFAHLFSILDKGSNVFSRNAVASKLRLATPYDVQRVRSGTSRGVGDVTRPADVSRHLDSLLLARYAAPGILVNEKLDIVEFRGQTGGFLQPAPGLPQNNLVKMARPGLLAAVRWAMAEAKSSKGTSRKSNVQFEQEGGVRTCDVVAIPFPLLKELKEQLFAVLFEPATAAGAAGRAEETRASDTAPPFVRPSGRGTNFELELEVELAVTKEYLESLVEEHGRTYEDLGSANEELISGNQELQSMNEELETAKEELQSTNEELTTLNEELRNRNVEATQVNSDLVNMLGTVSFPMLILDRERRIRRFTPAARDIWNVLPSDVGRPLDDIKPNIDAPDLDQRIAQVIAAVVAHESEIQDRAGKWYRLQIRPYLTSDNRIDGAILSLVDIDAMKRIIDQAQSAKNEAERANRAKDDFLAVLSHELRTPLSSMLLNAQLLRRSHLNPAKIQRAADAFERGIDMQTQLINDLLDVSRIVSGKLTVDMQVVSVAKVVKAALEVVSAGAQKKAVQIKLSLAPGIGVGSVMGDAARLQQALINLLINAIKFSPERGRVDVKVVKVDDSVQIIVSDCGVGISAEFLPHVFDRFAQADSSHTRVFGGLGLGLAIVRHLIEAHGGSVEAVSPGVGLGATFTISLPVPAAAADASARVVTEEGPSSEEGLPRARASLHGLSVLVVDDDRPTCEALAEVLEHAGAQVVIAGSVAAAMAASAHFQPRVLLCDIAMPGEDGYTLIRKWRTLGPPQGDVPALALTALVAKEDRARTLAAGFQMHLGKPVNIDQLLDALGALVARGAAPQAPV